MILTRRAVLALPLALAAQNNEERTSVAGGLAQKWGVVKREKPGTFYAIGKSGWLEYLDGAWRPIGRAD